MRSNNSPPLAISNTKKMVDTESCTNSNTSCKPNTFGCPCPSPNFAMLLISRYTDLLARTKLINLRGTRGIATISPCTGTYICGAEVSALE